LNRDQGVRVVDPIKGSESLKSAYCHSRFDASDPPCNLLNDGTRIFDGDLTE